MKLSQHFVRRLRELETNSRGKLFSHLLNQELQNAEAFANKTEQDGDSLILTFPDRSRLRVDNPTQKTDRATAYQLSNVG
jgi:hypothetical protein